MIKFSFKTFIRYVLMALAFSLVSMLISSCNVKADTIFKTFTVDQNKAVLRNASGNTIRLVDFKEPGDSTTVYSSNVLYGPDNPFIEFAWNYSVEVPENAKYFYISGYSDNFAITSAQGCEIVSGNSYFNFGNVANVLGIRYPFTFKCSLPSGNNKGAMFLRLITPNVDNIRLFSITVSKDFVFSTGVSEEDIAGLLQQQNVLQQQQIESQNKTNEKLDETNKNITNSDTSEATSSAESFFSGFESDDFGLTSVITAPLNLITSITSSTCKPLGFDVPFVNYKAELPCMGTIYKNFFGDFLYVYQIITFGMVSYWVCINIYSMVKGFKDPDSDKVEVLDL